MLRCHHGAEKGLKATKRVEAQQREKASGSNGTKLGRRGKIHQTILKESISHAGQLHWRGSGKKSIEAQKKREEMLKRGWGMGNGDKSEHSLGPFLIMGSVATTQLAAV